MVVDESGTKGQKGDVKGKEERIRDLCDQFPVVLPVNPSDAGEQEPWPRQ